MNALRKIALIFWFARRNLWEKRFRVVTVNCFLSLGLLVAMPLAVSGFRNGVEKRSRDELARNALNLCLWASGGTDIVLTNEKIDELRLGLEERLGKEHLRGVFGFDRTGQMDFKKTDGTSLWLYGQTALWNDPVLTNVPGAESLRDALKPSTEGIIITRDAMKELGFSETEKIALVRIKNRDDCPVLAIAQHPESADRSLRDKPVLPQRLDYIITERLYLRLQEVNAPYDSIRLGPIPPDWQARRRTLPQGVKDLLAKTHVQISKAPKADTWDLSQAAPRPWLQDNWKTFFDDFVAAMKAGKLPPPAESPPVLEFPDADVMPAPSFHKYVGIYTTDPESLEKAAGDCRDRGLHFDDEVVRKLAEISAQSREILNAFLALEFAIAVVAGANLIIIQYLRHRQRMAEIGMLKAMGMSRRMLRWLAVVEGGVLWFAGCAIGLAAGCGASWSLAAIKYGHAGLVRGFLPSLSFFWQIPAAAVVLSVFASLLGTAQARNTPPSITLHQ